LDPSGAGQSGTGRGRTMSRFRVPIEKPRPEIQNFLDAVCGKKVPTRAPMVEYLIDNAVMKPILKRK